VYRNYAHGASKRKMAFLHDFAEVWIAAATTALVRYADNDKRVWRNTANMLRRHADMVELDGLRALPWGLWGQSMGIDLLLLLEFANFSSFLMTWARRRWRPTICGSA
jgi:hypothetical protein